MIIDQVETLNKIATEFSNFAKLPSRNYEELNINDILKDVVVLMDVKGNIRLELDESNGQNVIGDRDEVKRALINIIKNSLQAIEEKESGEKGKVDIQSLRNNGYIAVRIKDNGVGIESDAKSKLFEPYFSTKSNGMGLGLVITKKILDDMKAKISVKSDIGKGTEVEIRFKTEEKS
jgi:nitrogen fixation/metabolism regulation signal transduction histidine kinase